MSCLKFITAGLKGSGEIYDGLGNTGNYDHPAYEWFDPEVSHIRTDTRRWVPRVVQWADNVANGKEDRRETLIRAEFMEGGTIGPVRDKPAV